MQAKIQKMRIYRTKGSTKVSSKTWKVWKVLTVKSGKCGWPEDDCWESPSESLCGPGQSHVHHPCGLDSSSTPELEQVFLNLVFFCLQSRPAQFEQSSPDKSNRRKPPLNGGKQTRAKNAKLRRFSQILCHGISSVPLVSSLKGFPIFQPHRFHFCAVRAVACLLG